MTVFAVIAFSMLLVMIGLIFDVGRVMNVHSETSAYADRAALAAAAELDGRPCAIGYAVTAVTGVDTPGCGYDRQIPSGRRLTLSGDSVVRVQRMTFRSALTPGAITATWQRGNSSVAYAVPSATAHRTTRFVTVETTTESENFLFFTMLGGPAQGSSVAPRATAGFERRVCNSIPLMVCNPDESTSGGGGGTFNSTPGRDFEVSLHYTNGYFDWRQGEYTLLDVPQLSPQALNNYMERSNPDTQCYGRSVAVEQDFNEPRREAILEGLEDRDDETFPVAIVNCRQHRNLLMGSQVNDPVPVEAWALVELEDTNYDEHFSPVRHEHYYLELEVRGLMPADESVAREFSVLTR